MKRILAVLTCLFLFCLTINAFVIGDIDANGTVSAMDARTALRAAANLETLDGDRALAADADCNGKITSSDARIILRVAANLDTFETVEPTIVTTTETIPPQVVAPTTVAPTTAMPTTIKPDSDIVYITPTGSKFHLSTCRTIKDSCIEISRSSAVAQGYKACKVCKP